MNERQKTFRFILLLLVASLFTTRKFCVAAENVDIELKDIFGRDITEYGITLVDWQGYMANPAIEFMIQPPSNAAFPVRGAITASEPRLYFNLPCEVGSDGPKKQVILKDDAPFSAFVAIFPARHKQSFELKMHIELTDTQQKKWQTDLPVHVIIAANHATTMSDTFPITVDFSQDKTGFFKDEMHRATVQQAAQDWSFYLEDMHLNPIGVGTEKTYIWERDGFSKSDTVTNVRGYNGFLLYAYGIDHVALRSGGEPSGSDFQMRGNMTLPMHRSGGLEVEIKGNYNMLGWLPPIDDQDWWKATNMNTETDLYSIVHHEMGHALFFNPANKNFQRNGVLKDDAVRAYLGTDIRSDIADHFNGFIDPNSLRGAFGNEYHGKVPLGRWLITKLDLLCAQAVGYKLRKVDALMPIAIVTTSLPGGMRGHPYNRTINGEGGIPFYDWQLVDGTLPQGLSLDRFTGQVTGTPSEASSSTFTVQLHDYVRNSTGVSRQLTIAISN